MRDDILSVSFIEDADIVAFVCQSATSVQNVKKLLFYKKAHRKVTHIKQQKYFHHLKRPGYNTEFLLYPRPFR